MNNRPFSKLEQFILYIFVFFMLREWLIPVIQLTETDHINLFLFFLALCLLLSVFRVHFLLSGTIKILYISWFLLFVYTNTAFFSVEGLSFLVNNLFGNISSVLNRDWNNVTDSFRSLLFILLLWMTVYLIQYWITIRHSIIYFFVMTVLFISILDTFSPYSGQSAIIKVMVLGLLLTGILAIKRITKQHNIDLYEKKYVLIVIPLVVMVGLSSIVAYALPKSAPIWSDPVPFIKSFAEGAGANGKGGRAAGKIGYDQDDTKLGGEFQNDDTVVFEALAEDKQYWRIETKDKYTTKGWEQTPAQLYESTFLPGEKIDMSIKPGPKELNKTAEINMDMEYNFIMQPYGLLSTSGVPADTSFSLDRDTEKLYTNVNGNTLPIKEYKVSYSTPKYSLKALKATTPESLRTLTAEYTKYLQLPENLPGRVRELATTITENKPNLYDQASAIEMYFRQNGFTYDQKDVPVPTENQDYVDQFLFDTKRGYCDNFSSSMVVLLRSVGIPARWVKGFAEGEPIKTEDGKTRFSVTNNDAHSWVEAYLPGIGWMSFEPTIGFTGMSNVNYDLDIQTENSNTPNAPDVPKKEKPTPKEEQKQQELEQKKASANAQNKTDWLKANKWWLATGFVVILLFGFVLYRLRRKWLPKVLIPLYRNKTMDATNFDNAYHRLLKQLATVGLVREEGQTLQSFAHEVDTHFETSDMKKLTTAYEQVIYRETPSKVNWNELRESWENLINRTSS